MCGQAFLPALPRGPGLVYNPGSHLNVRHGSRISRNVDVVVMSNLWASRFMVAVLMLIHGRATDAVSCSAEGQGVKKPTVAGVIELGEGKDGKFRFFVRAGEGKLLAMSSPGGIRQAPRKLRRDQRAKVGPRQDKGDDAEQRHERQVSRKTYHITSLMVLDRA